jgi:hypothetical protein
MNVPFGGSAHSYSSALHAQVCSRYLQLCNAPRDVTVKQLRVVHSLLTQIVNFELSQVALIQEPDHVLHVVPVKPFYDAEEAAARVAARESHSYYVLCDVRKVEVKAAVDVVKPALVRRNQLTHQVLHGGRGPIRPYEESEPSFCTFWK